VASARWDADVGAGKGVVMSTELKPVEGFDTWHLTQYYGGEKRGLSLQIDRGLIGKEMIHITRHDALLLADAIREWYVGRRPALDDYMGD